MCTTARTSAPAADTAPARQPHQHRVAAWRSACLLPLAASALLLATPASADPPPARLANAPGAKAPAVAAKPPYTLLHVFDRQGAISNPSTKLTLGPDGDLYGTSRSGGANMGGAIYRTNADGQTTTIYNFGFSHRVGRNPTSAPVFGSDGAIYGLNHIGAAGQGKTSVFRLGLDGRYTLLSKLTTAVSEPTGDLIRARDGYFYGVTNGQADCQKHQYCRPDQVIKFNEAGQFTVVHALTPQEGRFPTGGLAEGSDGNFYGLTSRGGTHDMGVAYRMTPDGRFTVLHAFAGGTAGGSYPSGALVQAPDGLFYGVTAGGGQHSKGVVFSMDAAGVVTTLYSFVNSGGRYNPTSGLALAPDGKLYGATGTAEPVHSGSAFRISTAGAFELLHAYADTKHDGDWPATGMTLGPDGLMYGTTRAGGTYGKGTVYRITASSALQTIHSFDPDHVPNGYAPHTGLLFASDGNRYGTTSSGTVFRISPNNDFKTLHEREILAGTVLKGDLIEMAPGVLLGTAQFGGANGKGTVFKMTLDGTLTVLHAFSGKGGDGAEPQGGLVKALDGNFYGTTQFGGTYGNGTIYRLTPDGGFSTLWHFNPKGPEMGARPMGTLALGPDGALYGVTYSGRARLAEKGTVYKISTAGEFTLLHQFDYMRTGARPSAGLVLASNGLLYGVTEDGPVGFVGSVFSISTTGELRTLHRFEQTGPYGYQPQAALTQARDGHLYGTASTGGLGPYISGTVYRVTLDGAMSLVYNFSPKAGRTPTARVIQGPDGALYGTTSRDGRWTTRGAEGEGVVFRLATPPPPAAPPR